MKSEIKVYSYPNGEIQRVQVVRWDDWSQLDFLYPKADAAALGCFADIYRNFLVPAFPWIFPQMVMFSAPEDEEVVSLVKNIFETLQQKTPRAQQKYNVTDTLIMASILLQEGIKLRKGVPVFANEEVEALYHMLEARNCIRIVCGKLPKTQVIPIGNVTGYLTQIEPDAAMKVNASFFIMDPIDCATIYDQVGTILGLCVKDGVVLNPPQYGREALLVKKDGSVSIRELDVHDMEIEIQGVRYKHGKNATIYTRPQRTHTPGGKGMRLVIVGNRIVDVRHGGRVEIPGSGFVLCLKDEIKKLYPEMEIIYHGLEDVQFGIQVGNSIIRDGIRTKQFISHFYNIYHLERVPYPPSLYPMDFEKARAARIAFGADKEGKPMLFWAEGAGKFGITPGVDSVGASLKEMADIATDLGMENAINLDGGGSAQILLKNQRSLHISDRKKEDNSDAERLIPLGLIVR